MYFVAYQAFVSALLFELLTAIVLAQFKSPEEEKSATIPADFVATFTEKWVHYDPEALKLIPVVNLTKFLCDIELEHGQFQGHIFNTKREATLALDEMNVATLYWDLNNDGVKTLHVHYVDVLQSLVKYLFIAKFKGDQQGVGDELDGAFVDSPAVTNNIIREFPDVKKKFDLGKGEIAKFSDTYAALLLQRSWRIKKARDMVRMAKALLAKDLVAQIEEEGGDSSVVRRMSITEMKRLLLTTSTTTTNTAQTTNTTKMDVKL